MSRKKKHLLPDPPTGLPAPSEPRETRRAAWLFALAAGVFGGLSFDPFSLRFLIPLAPLCLFAVMRLSPTPGRAFRRVLAGGWLFYFIAISWLTTLWRFNPFAPVGIMFVALYMAFFPALAAWMIRRWRGGLHVTAQFALLASLWLLAEWFRTLGRLCMPFTQLGHALAPWPWAIQWAGTFGELGLSLMVLIFSAAGFLAVRGFALVRPSPRPAWFSWAVEENETPRNAARAHLPASSVLAVGILMLASSFIMYRLWERRLAAVPQDQTLSVAAIQPNIDQETKMATNLEEDEAKREALLEQGNKIHMDLVRNEVPPETDLIVMPESTFSSFEFVFDAELHGRIVEMMRPMRGDLLFGADRIKVLNQEGDYEAFNTAWFLRNGSPIQGARYQDKVRLVPFGEYLPYFDMIPGFQETIVKIGSFTEGREMTLFETRGHKFGALICFESTFASQSRDFARLGAEFLAIITNDAWYGLSAGPPQHHHLSLLRAVETRRPVIRCANTGISSLISASGRAMESLALDRRGVLKGRIVPQKGRSLFVRWGNRPLVLAAAACAGVLLIRPPKQWLAGTAN